MRVVSHHRLARSPSVSASPRTGTLSLAAAPTLKVAIVRCTMGSETPLFDPSSVLAPGGMAMPATSTVRAAVVQAASVAFDRERTVKKVGDLAADAARRGAQLVVFPEAFVPGYPWGEVRTTEEREGYWASAVAVPAVDALGEIARE